MDVLVGRLDRRPTLPNIGGVLRGASMAAMSRLVQRALILPLAVVSCGCVSRPTPPEATWSEEPPPWPAPRHAISWIEASGVPAQDLGDDSDPWVLDLVVTVDGSEVEVPAFIGVDRLRAVQAPVHTHESGGVVWLEGEENRDMTLGNFFDLWGVRFDEGCVGAACEGLAVRADGEPVDDPRGLRLRGVELVTVDVHSV